MSGEPNDGGAGVNICGVLVHAMPARIEAVLASLRALDGVQIHQTAEDGRIVTTVEDTADATASQTLSDIHRLDGVIAAGLVYHHFEQAADEAAQAEEDSQ